MHSVSVSCVPAAHCLCVCAITLKQLGGVGGGRGGGGRGGGGGIGGEGFGGDGGEGGTDCVKQISQPALRTLPSVCHSIGVPSDTTPSGESLPQYLAPFTVRWSDLQNGLASTAKDVTEIGTAGGLVIVQSSLSE